MVAALLAPGSEINDGNRTQSASQRLTDDALEMGADIEQQNVREDGGEPIADLSAHADLEAGVTVPPERAPLMIDEYQVFVGRGFAAGETRMCGLAELGEASDRLAAIVDGLTVNGVAVKIRGDDLIITGRDGSVAGGGRPRCAMTTGPP